MPGRAAGRTSNTGFRCCASGCRSRRRWRTGSTGIRRAFSCSAGTRRRCGGWEDCSPRGRSRRCIGRSSSGVPRESEGRIEAALLKQPRGTVGWRMVVDPQGQQAVTDYRVLGAVDGRAWLELRPRTGRTHQIRVHCAALGSPDRRRPGLWRAGRSHAATARARDRAAALSGEAAGRGHGAGAAAHGRRAAGARLARRPGRFGAERGGVSAGRHHDLRRSVAGRRRAVSRHPPGRAAPTIPHAFSSTFEDESGKELSCFAARLDRSTVLGAFRGAELLGVAGFYVQPGPKHRHKGMLWGMYVRPQARGGRNWPAGWSRRSSSMRAITSS